MNAKTCKICGDRFIPLKTFINTCSDGCKAIQTIRDREKVKKKEHRKAIQDLNDQSIPYLLNKAQKLFNKFIRLRDGILCISCGVSVIGVKHDAGHFMSVGRSSAIRFDENNCHSQCVSCNQHQSSNNTKYRPALIKKIGIEEVERLETSRQVKQWKREEVLAITEQYKTKIKGLTNESR